MMMIILVTILVMIMIIILVIRMIRMNVVGMSHNRNRAIIMMVKLYTE
jgi:hypothetical protein